ncbi:MAG: D-sedoheptulose 7-phosphate isomerase [bacterium]|nr:D-sedoheptulose 7-phosphate isomerase [bacterium]
MRDYLKAQLAESLEVKTKLINSDSLDRLASVVEACLNSLRNGGKILIAGNGGSAADAQHIAGELVSRFYFDRPALPAIALTTDTSILTAIGNDYGYERVFERQVEALGREGDIFIGLSTSGSSKNVIRAAEAAKLRGIFCIGFAGEKRGALNEICDLTLNAPSTVTPRIQEVHITLGHILCAAIESEMFGPPSKP